MTWSNVDLTTVNPAMEIVPAQEYVFSLGGAKYGESDPNRIEVNASIVTEGDFTGRKIFWSYPDPSKPKCEWAPKALKRLEMALGVDAEPMEDPVTYLNRAAGSHFSGEVYHRPATNDYPARAELKLNSVKPAA